MEETNAHFYWTPLRSSVIPVMLDPPHVLFQSCSSVMSRHLAMFPSALIQPTVCSFHPAYSPSSSLSNDCHSPPFIIISITFTMKDKRAMWPRRQKRERTDASTQGGAAVTTSTSRLLRHTFAVFVMRSRAQTKVVMIFHVCPAQPSL